MGRHLKPKVKCIVHIQNRGAGIPDAGLFASDQLRKTAVKDLGLGALPARGVVEAKPAKEDLGGLIGLEQVSRYCQRYGQVLLTNFRSFVLVGYDRDGHVKPLESFELFATETALREAARQPDKAVSDISAEHFVEFLRRVLLKPSQITSPKDVAELLASYARDARTQAEAAPSGTLHPLRSVFEEALGLKFEGAKGEHFFRSSLVQTLFYGIFSAWVLWSREHQHSDPVVFSWREATWHLHLPILRKLFHEVADPGNLEVVGLTPILDSAGDVLNRVEREAFFSVFDDGKAVQYFYEPFLEAFDPQLRKELGVWYTPPEVVKYMVARVDDALRKDLGIAAGLADPRVVVLDPCCGTGAFLVEVLERIGTNLSETTQKSLVAYQVKIAARTRVFGFELLTAPFVVAHLQLGLLLKRLGAPLTDAPSDRIGVYLTNALTGWEPPKGPKKQLVFPEFQAERDAAERVKQTEKILVILGNPPYNGFAGIATGEEHDLKEAYRHTVNKALPKPEGQGLNELYVRFFRMADRRIVEHTGYGVICFISNYSWLKGRSHPAMRERYLSAFDRIAIDSLNGDKFKTGKVTPDGLPDPSVFSTESNPEGIGVGTAISLLVRTKNQHGGASVQFRDLWGAKKRAQLVKEAEHSGVSYVQVEPCVELRLPFAPAQVSPDYLTWLKLPELFPSSSPGINTSRDLDLVDMDREKLRLRIEAYFDPKIPDEGLKNITPSLLTASARFDPIATRSQLLSLGIKKGHFVRYAYRPFDIRWLFWYPQTKLLDEKRDDLFKAFQKNALFLTSRAQAERSEEGSPFYATRCLPDRHLTRPGSNCFPTQHEHASNKTKNLFAAHEDTDAHNLSQEAITFCRDLGFTGSDAEQHLWNHILAIGHSPLYLRENADGIELDWPRIPLPTSRESFVRSSQLGEQVLRLLLVEDDLPGVSSGPIWPQLEEIAVLESVDGGALDPDAGDLNIDVGWGHFGRDQVIMPGQGKMEARAFSPREQASLQKVPGAEMLGDHTIDVYLNEKTLFRNIPEPVWEYALGGYKVLPKWLSYREGKVLGRALSDDEANLFASVIRRIAFLLLIAPELDHSYSLVASR